MAKKERIGIVASNKSEKTAIIIVQMRYQHPKYSKTILKTKRYMVHDEKNDCKPGDIVLVEETTPISKKKNWKLKKILKIYEQELELKESNLL
jgi:small subunit ribosomal protein S17